MLGTLFLRDPGARLDRALAHEGGIQRSQPLTVVRVRVAEELACRRQPDRQQNETGFDAVAPRELLALLAGAPRVVDGHLVDPITEAQDAAGDLGFDVEAVASHAE